MKIHNVIIILSLMVFGCRSHVHPLNQQVSVIEANTIIDEDIHDWRYMNATKTLVRSLTKEPPSKVNILKTLELAYKARIHWKARWTPGDLNSQDQMLVFIFSAAKPLNGTPEQYKSTLDEIKMTAHVAQAPDNFFKVANRVMKKVDLTEEELFAMHHEALAVFWMVVTERDLSTTYFIKSADAYAKLAEDMPSKKADYENKARYLNEAGMNLQGLNLDSQVTRLR